MHLPGSNQGQNGINNMSVNPASQEQDFSEFLWMAEEDLETFDNKVIREVEERVQQHLMGRAPHRGEEEDFLQQMLEEEEARDTVYFQSNTAATLGGSVQMGALQNHLQRMQLAGGVTTQNGHLVSNQQCPMRQPVDFQLNPDAAVFVPRDDAPKENNQDTDTDATNDTDAVNDTSTSAASTD